MEWKITKDNVGQRLDIFLQSENKDKTRSHIKHWIERGDALVNGDKVKAGYSLKSGDIVSLGEIEEKVLSAKPQDIPIDIVYEDDDLAIINKPQGMVVHPAINNFDGTLVNALMYKLDSLSSINGIIRPGIVHRLDKDTSGLLVVAKNDNSHVNLSRQIANKECRRIYWALLEGVVKSDGDIKTFMGRDPKNRLKMAVLDSGKEAETKYKVLEVLGNYTLVEFELKTGRTHQIRVHVASLGAPILGDTLYGKESELIKRQALHAYFLAFPSPINGETVTVRAPLPKDISEAMKAAGLPEPSL